MYCTECKNESPIYRLGAVEYGTVYYDGLEKRYYPELECGHTEYISISPIGNVPENAEEIVTQFFDEVLS